MGDMHRFVALLCMTFHVTAEEHLYVSSFGVYAQCWDLLHCGMHCVTCERCITICEATDIMAWSLSPIPVSQFCPIESGCITAVALSSFL